MKQFLPTGQVWWRVWILDVWSENRLFTVPYFSVRSSRYSASYQLPSCMSPAPSVHFKITMAAINGKISRRSHGKIRDSEQSSLKKGVENDIFLVWNRVRIWRTGRHTPTKNSQEYIPLPGISPTALKHSHRNQETRLILSATFEKMSIVRWNILTVHNLWSKCDSEKNSEIMTKTLL